MLKYHHMNETLFDVIILGGGPAGCAAAVYAARKGLKTALVTKEFGGQSIVSEKIFNWIGTPEISGAELGKSLQKHVEYYKDIEIFSNHVVQKVQNHLPDPLCYASNLQAEPPTKEEGEKQLEIITDKTTLKTRSVLYTLGSSRRKLNAVGADLFEHKGLTYCASCDGPLFSGMDVAVIGGGNAGFESALQLLAYCSTVTLVHKNADFKADETTIEKARAYPNFKTITSATIHEVTGDGFINGLVYSTNGNEEKITLPVSGIFVEIGGIPNTAPLSGLCELTNSGLVVTDPKTQRTSHPLVWAAGDCTDGLYHQNNIAAGDAVKALEDLYLAIS